MKKVRASILTLSLLSLIFVKKKETHFHPETLVHTGSVDLPNATPPVVFGTSLHDSVPAHLLSQMGLPDVNGTKLKFLNGNFASHFRYNAPAERVLRTLSMIPVPFSDVLADTTYRRIPHLELNTFVAGLSAFEKDEFPDFVNAASSGVDAYECIKPPFRHIVLISRTDNSVFHRVEYAV